MSTGRLTTSTLNEWHVFNPSADAPRPGIKKKSSPAFFRTVGDLSDYMLAFAVREFVTRPEDPTVNYVTTAHVGVTELAVRSARGGVKCTAALT